MHVAWVWARLRCQARKVVIIILPAAAVAVRRQCLRQNHSWATLQFRDYCCVRLHHLSLDGSCSQSQHTISTNFIFSNIVGLLAAGSRPNGRPAGGVLQCRHCTTVIIGDKCLHHFCSPRDSTRPPEFQNFWWGQAYVVGIICPSDWNRVTNPSKYDEDQSSRPHTFRRPCS